MEEKNVLTIFSWLHMFTNLSDFIVFMICLVDFAHLVWLSFHSYSQRPSNRT